MSLQSLPEVIEKHLEKLSSEPSSDAAEHWRSELRELIDQCRHQLPSLGRRTAEGWQMRIEVWEARLGGLDDDQDDDT